jgi:hypothetical protein
LQTALNSGTAQVEDRFEAHRRPGQGEIGECQACRTSAGAERQMIDGARC